MKKAISISLFCVIAACSPKVVDTLETPPTGKAAGENQAPENSEYTNNPCTTLDELEPGLKSDTEDAYTIYRDYMRQKDYDGAFEIWKNAYYTAPAANGRIRYQFDDGITIYKHLFKNAKTEELKKQYADSIFSIYDKRIECHPGDEYTVLGKKAFNSYYDLRGYIAEDEVWHMFRKAFDGKDKNADYFIINPFSRMLYDRVLTEKINLEQGSIYALKILELVKENLEKCEGKECEPWEIINEYAPGLLEALEGIKGFYPCDYFMDKYYDDYLANTGDCNNVTEVYLRLRYGQCPIDDAKMTAVITSKDKNCYVPPPPEGPLKKAYRALNEGQFREAIAFYDQYLSTATDNNKKADILLRVSKIYYVHIKDFVKARSYARNAANFRANWGEPFILIGKLYASSGPLCGPGRGWDSQIVTWPAIDKFRYAKKIDPSVAAEANKLIAQYEQYMPSMEDIFQRRLHKNDDFMVECWIKEKTKIRPAL